MGNTVQSALSRRGWNAAEISLVDQMTSQERLYPWAYCYAIDCTGGNTNRVFVNIKKHRNRCPNCGNALRWVVGLGQRERNQVKRGDLVLCGS